MRHKIELNLPKTLQNASKSSELRVFWAESDEGIEIRLDGVVGDEYTESDAGSINRVLSRNKNKPVTLRVNSFGGLAFDGLAIHNALIDHSGPTTGIIESVAASAASLAVIGTDQVKIYDNAIYHIHEGLAGAFGHIAEIEETVDWLRKFNAAAAMTYAAKTGKSVDDMAAALLGANGDGTKYNAQEALAAGFVDEIISTTKKQKPERSAKAETKLNLMLHRQRLLARLVKSRMACN